MRYDIINWLVVMLTHSSEETCVALEAYSHHLNMIIGKLFILNDPENKFLQFLIDSNRCLV